MRLQIVDDQGDVVWSYGAKAGVMPIGPDSDEIMRSVRTLLADAHRLAEGQHVRMPSEADTLRQNTEAIESLVSC